MSIALRDKRKSKQPTGAGKAERLARELGGRVFDVNEKVEAPKISDGELEEFLKWRNEVRKAEREAEIDCLP